MHGKHGLEIDLETLTEKLTIEWMGGENKKRNRCFSQRTGPLYKTNLTNRHKNLLLSRCKVKYIKRYYQIFR